MAVSVSVDTVILTLSEEQTSGLNGNTRWYLEWSRNSEVRTMVAGAFEVINK
jgi:hypothetical protein